MSSKDIAVSVRGLSKSYTIAHNSEKHTTMAEAILHRFKNPLQQAKTETFWALKDVEFDIKKGDVVGIIGRNGAGKSTLLKVLSQITEPTKGEVQLYGRVGSLLEVGTGFHPELTGRENIFLNGAILGLRKSEIQRQFDAIVDFAGVEKFLDTPVKRYSSGMYVRLAFAVAAHLNSEILIIDEVLAVGDAEFQKKCMGKMKDVAGQEGKTVIFVSHNMAAVGNLCSSCLILKSGSKLFYGTTEESVQNYLQLSVQTGANHVNLDSFRPSWATSFITSARVLNQNKEEQKIFPMDADITFEMSFQAPSGRLLNNPMMGILINHATYGAISNVSTHLSNFQSNGPYSSANMTCTISQIPLLPGSYTVDTWLGDGSENLDALIGHTSFQIELSDVYKTGRSPYSEGIVFLKPQFEIL